MRIVLMADSFGATGGGEVMVAYLARQLRQRHEVAILTAGPEATGRSTWEGLKLIHIESSYHPRLRPALSIANPRTMRYTREALAELRPDVVHAWNVHHHLGYESLRQASALAPVVHTAQDALAFCYTKFHCWIDPAALNGASQTPRAHPERCRNCRSHFWLFPVRNRLVRGYLSKSVSVPVSVSHALANALVANGLRPTRVVYNGIPAEDFASRSVDAGFDERWRLNGGPAVLVGGRLSHFKGHELAVRAFQRAAENSAEARLLVMGGHGWYGEHLANLAASLGIGNRVRFLGLVPREEVPLVLARSRAVLNLSMYLDPFPTMNLEAMASSRAVIGTCFGGTPEAVQDGQTGYIVNPYDQAGVAVRLQSLLSNPDDATRMGNAGRQRLLEHFRIEQMASNYEELYLEAVESAPSVAVN